jgi:hypothetical protein
MISLGRRQRGGEVDEGAADLGVEFCGVLAHDLRLYPTQLTPLSFAGGGFTGGC